MTTATEPRPANRLEPSAPSVSPEEHSASPHWSPATTIAFRFCFVYFGLYVLLTQMLSSLIPVPVINVPELGDLLPVRALVLWVGRSILGIAKPIAFAPTGSGDRTYDFVQVVIFLVVAAVATTAWSLRARDTARDVRLYRWFRLFARFSLGTSLLSYGLVKVVPLQMPFQLRRLVEPYGNFSPMGVLWSSIGSSFPYEIFVGGAECLGGILLFFPRTATIGALICLADVIEVWMLNMTYDVPVKLFSFHLILMSVFLLAPNIRRLVDFFLKGRPAQLAPEPALGRSPRAQRNWVVAQRVFAAYVITVGLLGSITGWNTYGGGGPKSPLYGIWSVERMSVDGVEQPPLTTDSTRWKHVIFQQLDGAATFQRMNDNFRGFQSKIDTVAHTLALTAGPGKPDVLKYQRPDRNRLLLDGTMQSKRVHLELAWRDPDAFQLRSRGFHIISETPFNR